MSRYNAIEMTCEEVLLPCPFCAGDEIEVKRMIDEMGDYSYFTECFYCGASSLPTDTLQDTVKLWNTRPKIKAG